MEGEHCRPPRRSVFRERSRSWWATAGAATSIGNQAAGIVGTIVSVPLITRTLGPESLGTWYACLALVGLLQIVDFGTTTEAVNRFAKLFRSPESCDGAQLGRDVAGLCCIVLAAGGAAGVTVIAVAQFGGLDFLFSESDPSAVVAARLTLSVAAALSIVLYIQQLAVVLAAATQRMAVVAVGDLTGRVLGLAALVLVWKSGLLSLWLVPVCILAPIALARLALLYWLFALVPRLRPTFSTLRLHHVWRQIRESRLFFVGNVSELAYTQLPLLVLASVGNERMVAAYAVPYQLFFGVYTVMSLILSQYWPAIAEASALREDVGRFARRYRRIRLACTITASTLCVALVPVAGPLVRIWSGEDLAASWMLLLGFAVLFAQQTYNLGLVVPLTALGFIHQRTTITVALAFAAVPLAVIGVGTAGAAGLALALAGALAVTQTQWLLRRGRSLVAPF